MSSLYTHIALVSSKMHAALDVIHVTDVQLR